MVTVVKRMLKGKTYYYLEHTIRNEDKRTTKSKYLGNTLPKNIESLRKKFTFEINKVKWFNDFQRIRSNYNAELKATSKSVREKEQREFSIRFTYNTQRIEGSTLTFRETAQLLEQRISPSGKPVEDVKEAEAHDRVFHEMLEVRKELSQESVQAWHRNIFKETKPDIAGQVRRHGVRITGSRFLPPSPVELQPMLDDFFGWYHGTKKKTNPVELAGLVHLRFVTLHPFSDGNGRISRLMMNFVLHNYGCPMLNIEYKGRITYYSSLERSQLNKDERPFMNWFFRRYKREHRRFLAI